MKNEQEVWREAFVRLNEIDSLWNDDAKRISWIKSCREWMEQQEDFPRLVKLAPLLNEEMDRRSLWSVLVPVERSVIRMRITDVEILDCDLPEGSRQGTLMPVKVVVDSMRSAFNFGGILRTSECFGVDEVILCGYTPLPDQIKVARTAMGTDSLVKWRYVENVRKAVSTLIEEGITCYALETVEGASVIEAVEWKFPCALVVGNERFGLDPDVVEMCNGGAVRIKLFGSKNSLNVVSAFSVAAYQVRQQFD